MNLKLAAEALQQYGSMQLQGAAPAEAPRINANLVSLSEVRDHIVGCPAQHVEALQESIFNQQHKLWQTLTAAIQQIELPLSIPDLTPEVHAGRATEALLKAAAQNTSAALCELVLITAAQELAPRQTDTTRLQAVLGRVRDYTGAVPTLPNSVTGCHPEDPTWTGSTVEYSTHKAPSNQACRSGQAIQAFGSLAD
jgi:hypothetical protein